MNVKLDATLGEEAETLMELLPPVGWADVATKQDLEHQTQLFDLRMKVLEHKVDAKFAGMLQAQDARFDQVDAKFAGMLQAQDARFDQVDARFDLVDARIDGIDTKFDTKFETVATREQISDLRSEFRGGLVALLTGLLTSQFSLGVLYLLTK